MFTDISKHKKSFIEPAPVLDILDEDTVRSKKIYKSLISKSAPIKFKNILEEAGFIDIFKKRLQRLLGNMGIAKVRFEDWDAEIERFAGRRLKKPQERQARRYLIQQMLSRGYRVIDISQKLKLSRKTIYFILQGQG